MSRTQIIELRTQLRRAMQAGDDVTAQEIALQLAPFEDALAERLDRDPCAITLMWGLEA